MRFITLIIFPLFFEFAGFAQVVNRQHFFLDDKPIEATLTTDIKNLIKQKKVIAWQAANIKMAFSDTLVIEEMVRVQPRGEYRKNNCEIASLMIDFKTTTSPRLSPLKKLKLVGGCTAGSQDEELLLKEFLAYKIYNHLTNMSFRVRLLHINYLDSKKNSKGYSQYAFLIEDSKDMAERNNCRELKSDYYTTESTNRQHMTLISLFQYMIGNTDWAVPKQHNMKLLTPNNDTLAMPYAVPYDFDYCGLVDAPYAVPPEQFNTTSVTERVYRGFPRTMQELKQAIEVFNEKKSAIMFTINNFELLSSRVRSRVADYIEDFYELIASEKKVNSLFIKNARTE